MLNRTRLFACTIIALSTAAPIDEIRALDEKFNKLYNNGQYEAVASLYAADAVLIPPTADSFIPQSQLAEFFKEAASSSPPITNLNLQPVSVQEDSSGMTRHEIGNVTHSLEPAGGAYYVRWTKIEGSWKIATDIMAIGGP